ncbi:MAG: 50S ribosomal protein L17 [Alphaproteobacteria bacterium]|nr:50S ribosomal protein L17 [Alphaproteobacteria bacterium]
MRHKLSGRKLNRTSAHRRALFANLAKGLIISESIQTTLPKAKELRPYIEKLLTKARIGSLHARRQLVSVLGSESAAKKLIEEIAPRFVGRNGGYTRIVKAGFRYGDNAPMAVIQFVDYKVPVLEVEDEEDSD